MTLNVAVTGSTGFLGNLIAQSLERKGVRVHHVNRSLSKSQLSFGEKGSFIEAASSAEELQAIFCKLGIQVVVHAATHFTPSRDIKVIPDVVRANFDFSVRVFEAAKRSGSRFINFNSFWQDAHSEDGMGPYAATKEAFRHYLGVASSASMRVENIYVPETFGPNDPRDKVIANLISSKITGGRYEIRNKEAKIDLSYAPFLADFVGAIATDGPAQQSKYAFVNFREVPLGILEHAINKIGEAQSNVNPPSRPTWIGRPDSKLAHDRDMKIEGMMPESSLTDLLEYAYFTDFQLARQ